MQRAYSLMLTMLNVTTFSTKSTEHLELGGWCFDKFSHKSCVQNKRVECFKHPFNQNLRCWITKAFNRILTYGINWPQKERKKTDRENIKLNRLSFLFHFCQYLSMLMPLSCFHVLLWSSYSSVPTTSQMSSLNSYFKYGLLPLWNIFKYSTNAAFWLSMCAVLYSSQHKNIHASTQLEGKCCDASVSETWRKHFDNFLFPVSPTDTLFLHFWIYILKCAVRGKF